MEQKLCSSCKTNPGRDMEEFMFFDICEECEIKFNEERDKEIWKAAFHELFSLESIKDHKDGDCDEWCVPYLRCGYVSHVLYLLKARICYALKLHGSYEGESHCPKNAKFFEWGWHSTSYEYDEWDCNQVWVGRGVFRNWFVGREGPWF